MKDVSRFFSFETFEAFSAILKLIGGFFKICQRFFKSIEGFSVVLTSRRQIGGKR